MHQYRHRIYIHYIYYMLFVLYVLYVLLFACVKTAYLAVEKVDHLSLSEIHLDFSFNQI